MAERSKHDLGAQMHDGVQDTLHAGPLRLRVGSRLAGGRLHVLERLGRGGMGIVYRAYDDLRRSQVALKTMNRIDPLAIYALKNEFRALADVHHPNLVRLFELFCEGDDWFFTMELVPGERFDRWVRPNGELDADRLRRAYAQLLDGIEAVHSCGKLHRDIKSSNVLVTEEGHVVVLDFGLVTEGQAHSIGETVTDGGIVGTPAYLAPEQFLGGPASVASDLYALGVVLFEALTGQLPFSGSNVELLAAKQQNLPPEAAWVRGAPPDLVALCARLLSYDASVRPTLSDLRSYFSAERESGVRAPVFRSTPPLPAAELIGRDGELRRLREAFLASREGRPVVVSVAGESGIGKSALCGAFLDELVHEGAAVVLRGRCNERESVPFKALDSLVDSLSRYLRRMRSAHVASLLPRDAAALTTLFPVLARVEAFADAPVRPLSDPHDQLRRAFAAFHELLGRICDRGPLVLHIDDLQWTDRDSTQLLRYVLRRADQLPALFLFSHRGDANADPELAELLESARANRHIELQRIELAPLSLEAATLLARRWLPPANDGNSLAERIEQEARGNPFLIGEFARYVASSGVNEPEELTLRGALDARILALPEPARKLLSVLALAGKPVAGDLLLAVSGATYESIDTLQNAHLLRSSRSRGERGLETYHDRIRERVCETISPSEAQALFRELSQACAERADVDADTRCAYLEGAGDVAGAAACAAAAADQATAALAFDHAAHLYGKALELGVYTPAEALQLTQRAAEALGNAGRSLEAAAAYQRAALLAGGDDSLDLRRHAAEQLLIAGHAGQGFALLESLCSEVDLELPSQAELGRARLSLSLASLRLTAPLLRFGDRPIERRRALRLDVLQTANVGMLCYSRGGGAQLALEYLREALRAGAANHAVWALGTLAMLTSLRAFGPQLVAQMEDLATRDGRRELRGLVYGLRGWLASRNARHREARSWFAKAQAVYADCIGMQWQIDLVHVFDQASASALGDYVEVMRTTPALIEDAFRCGRVWTGTMLTGFWGMAAWLAQDDAAGYRLQLSRARAQWTRHGQVLTLDRASYGLFRAEVMLSLYEGVPLSGLELLSRTGAALTKATHRRDHEVLQSLCAVSALGAARRGELQLASRSQLRAKGNASSELRRSAATRGYAHVCDAALALDDGRRSIAARELRAAAEHFEATGWPMLALAARRRLGQLIGGDEGRALVVRADAFLTSQQVRDPEAMTELLCPGCVSEL
ncbi:MAG TPA: protein kinase [Polyangiales bacterium]|nr:protein kinase [Polyangiales bacterium]